MSGLTFENTKENKEEGGLSFDETAEAKEENGLSFDEAAGVLEEEQRAQESGPAVREFAFNDPKAWEALKDDFFACRGQNHHVLVERSGKRFRCCAMDMEFSITGARDVYNRKGVRDAAEDMLESMGESMEAEELYCDVLSLFRDANFPNGMDVPEDIKSLMHGQDEEEKEKPADIRQKEGVSDIRTAKHDIRMASKEDKTKNLRFEN